MRETIEVKGARENNLKNIDVEIPRNKLVVVTGMSGSGKSSLAFDTVYAEGQRRFMESGVPPVESGDVYRVLRQYSKAVCRHGGGQSAGVYGFPVQF